MKSGSQVIDRGEICFIKRAGFVGCIGVASCIGIYISFHLSKDQSCSILYEDMLARDSSLDERAAPTVRHETGALF